MYIYYDIMEKINKKDDFGMKNDVEKIKLSDVNLKNLNFKVIKGLYFEYKEVINYLVFGGLSTVVNFVSYFIFARIVSIEEVTSSGLSWFCAVLFAYITNKLFVFESKTNNKKDFFKEIVYFFACRVLSGILVSWNWWKMKRFIPEQPICWLNSILPIISFYETPLPMIMTS